MRGSIADLIDGFRIKTLNLSHKFHVLCKPRRANRCGKYLFSRLAIRIGRRDIAHYDDAIKSRKRSDDADFIQVHSQLDTQLSD
jgi:hypothetical protein